MISICPGHVSNQIHRDSHRFSQSGKKPCLAIVKLIFWGLGLLITLPFIGFQVSHLCISMQRYQFFWVNDMHWYQYEILSCRNCQWLCEVPVSDAVSNPHINGFLQDFSTVTKHALTLENSIIDEFSKCQFSLMNFQNNNFQNPTKTWQKKNLLFKSLKRPWILKCTGNSVEHGQAL